METERIRFDHFLPVNWQLLPLGNLTSKEFLGMSKFIDTFVQYHCSLTLSTFIIGTGVVTSVPSDSPDDFAALRDLKAKEVA